MGRLQPIVVRRRIFDKRAGAREDRNEPARTRLLRQTVDECYGLCNSWRRVAGLARRGSALSACSYARIAKPVSPSAS